VTFNSTGARYRNALARDRSPRDGSDTTPALLRAARVLYARASVEIPLRARSRRGIVETRARQKFSYRAQGCQERLPDEFHSRGIWVNRIRASAARRAHSISTCARARARALTDEFCKRSETDARIYPAVRAARCSTACQQWPLKAKNSSSVSSLGALTSRRCFSRALVRLVLLQHAFFVLSR